MKVAVNCLGKFSCSMQSRSNVPRMYACARQFFARLASEIFLSSLRNKFINDLLVRWAVRHDGFRAILM
jgi:hypothetical protein